MPHESKDLKPRFYITMPEPCVYLAKRHERKLFTTMDGPENAKLANQLSQQGFRRSQNVVYRPCCEACMACLSARIKVADFHLSRSQKRVKKKNIRLIRLIRPARATTMQYALFRRYVTARHPHAGMSDLSYHEFSAMIESTPLMTFVIEYHDPGKANTLTAVCLTDRLNDGPSLVYSFYDPDDGHPSLGTYMILDHVDLAREWALPYVYLGYWVPGSPKMDYKRRFAALEIYKNNAWQDMGHPDQHRAQGHITAPPSLSDQLSRIYRSLAGVQYDR